MQSVKLILGKPKAGWLPVGIYTDNYKLSIEASDLGYNVIDQLIDLLLKLENTEDAECYFYLEPSAYILKVKPVSDFSTLQIQYLEDFDSKENQNNQIMFHCIVSSSDFKKSIIDTLKNFLHTDYSETDWPAVEKKHLLNQFFSS